MSPLTFQELASVGEEALHTGRNVVQILAIGKAVANLISGKNLISPSYNSAVDCRPINSPSRPPAVTLSKSLVTMLGRPVCSFGVSGTRNR